MRSGEDACVASDSTHAARGRIVNGAAREHVEVRIGAWLCLALVVVRGGSDAWEQRCAPVAGGAGVAHMAARSRSPGDCGTDDPMRPAGFVDGQIACLGHAERLEDVLLRVDVERFAGEGLDDVTEQDEVDVGVAEHRFGSRLQWGGERAIDSFDLVWLREAPRVFQVHVGGLA